MYLLLLLSLSLLTKSSALHLSLLRLLPRVYIQKLTLHTLKSSKIDDLRGPTKPSTTCQAYPNGVATALPFEFPPSQHHNCATYCTAYCVVPVGASAGVCNVASAAGALAASIKALACAIAAFIAASSCVAIALFTIAAASALSVAVPTL